MADTTLPTPAGVPMPGARRSAVPASWGAAVRDAVAGTFAVVGAGTRLWLRHWPVLLTFALLGGAGRMAAIWGAIEASDKNNTLGVLDPRAGAAGVGHGDRPHAVRAAALAAAHRHGRRHRRAGERDHAAGERRLLDVLASVLVPFLAVYASYGLLREDTDRFINSAVADEFLNNADIFYNPGNAIDTDRFVFATGWLALAIVAGAVVLRWGLARLEGARGWLWLGFAGAYVEVLWLTTLAAHVTIYKDKAWDWVETRKGVDIFAGWWLDLLDRLGPLANPVDAATDWLFGVLGDFDALVVIPLSWLAVGAVVYGHRLVGRRPSRSAGNCRILAAVPKPVRRLCGEVFADVRERFTGSPAASGSSRSPAWRRC